MYRDGDGLGVILLDVNELWRDGRAARYLEILLGVLCCAAGNQEGQDRAEEKKPEKSQSGFFSHDFLLKGWM
jgi:hypothetical protein